LTSREKTPTLQLQDGRSDETEGKRTRFDVRKSSFELNPPERNHWPTGGHFRAATSAQIELEKNQLPLKFDEAEKNPTGAESKMNGTHRLLLRAAHQRGSQYFVHFKKQGETG
jgi:hypothetical protein